MTYRSSLHRHVRKLRRFLEPLRREILPVPIGEPETRSVDSTLLEVWHPRQVGAHLLRAYADKRSGCLLDRGVVGRGENGRGKWERRCPAERSETSPTAAKHWGSLGQGGHLLATEPSERRRGVRQHIEIAISSLKRMFGLSETLATMLVVLATRIAAKIMTYTDTFHVNRLLGGPQGCIKELWA